VSKPIVRKSYVLNGIPFTVHARRPKRAGHSWLYIDVPGFKLEWTAGWHTRARFKSQRFEKAARKDGPR